MAAFVNRPDAVNTDSLPNAAMAAVTEGRGPYSQVVVTSNCAMSDCIRVSSAPYSALPNPPKRTLPSWSTVISFARRSPCEIT